MSYQRSTLKLVFEDPQFDGLEVRIKRLPIGKLFAVTELADLGDDLSEMKEQFFKLTDMVGESLLSWNLTEGDEEEPVPADAEGLRSQDIEFVLGIVTAWTEAATAVTPPLPNRSNSGPPSPEQFELMERVLESQLS